jgi:hypothetical protein
LASTTRAAFTTLTPPFSQTNKQTTTDMPPTSFAWMLLFGAVGAYNAAGLFFSALHTRPDTATHSPMPVAFQAPAVFSFCSCDKPADLVFIYGLFLGYFFFFLFRVSFFRLLFFWFVGVSFFFFFSIF